MSSSRHRFMPVAVARAAASKLPNPAKMPTPTPRPSSVCNSSPTRLGPRGAEGPAAALIEETAAIDRELYLGIVLDRATGKLVFMASQAGGMEIEEVAAKTPEAIFKESIDPAVGFGAWQARKLAFALGLKPTQIDQAVTFFQSLCAKPSSTPMRPSSRSIPSSRPGRHALLCTRCQDHFRRQRALPPRRHQGPARA